MCISDIAIGALKGLNIVTGRFVAELHHHLKDSTGTALPLPIPALLILLGLFLAGYPQDSPSHAPWSHKMETLMQPLTPRDADLRRYWDHLGASVLLLGTFFSPTARRLLASPPFSFLGRLSFPVYLLHNTMIKSVLTWMVYLASATHPRTDDAGNRRDLQRASAPLICGAVLLYLLLLYRAAALWARFVDPFCAGVVARVLDWAGEWQ